VNDRLITDHHEQVRKALTWIAGQYCTQHWITDVAQAVLNGEDVPTAIKKGEESIRRYLETPSAPSTLDGGYSQMGSGFGGRGR
jgi:hypothetical protein